MKRIVTALVFTVVSFTAFSQGLKISNTPGSPNSSSMLEVESTTKGFLPPRMSTTERDLIGSPAEGLVIYNTTTDCLNYYNGSNWLTLCGVCPTTPPTATAATNASATQFDANWNAVAGATSYQLDVATDANFTSFVSGFNSLNVGNVTTYTVSGLNSGTTYYYRLRSVNACGASANSNTITAVAQSACAALGGQMYGGFCWIPTGVRNSDAEVNCSTFCASLGKTCNSTVMQGISQTDAGNIVHLFHPGVTLTSSGDAPSYQWVTNTGNYYVEANTCTHNDNVVGRERYCVCTPEP